MNIPTYLLSPALLREMAANTESAEAMKPAIMATYRRLEKYVNLTGSKSKVFSLIAVSLVNAYKKGRACPEKWVEPRREPKKAGIARRKAEGGHFG